MDINLHLNKLREFIEEQNFKGYDPYDALNSPFLNAISFNKYLRLAFIQFFKRTPINLRRLFWVKKGYNPKGLGLFLWGYTKLYSVKKEPFYLESINLLLELLEQERSEGCSGYAWGYNFDWQSRAFFIPKYTPTIVNSAFIGHALLDTYLVTGVEKALNMAVSIKDFISKDLNRTHDNGSICFSYTPIDNTAVHNASLLGASLLIRLCKYSDDSSLKDTALSSLEYTMKYQCDNGSWHYAETDYQKWIDSYHTGFNLQSVQYFLQEGVGKEYQDKFEKGVRFYKDNFFLKDGTPKFYHDRTYPIDIHAPAQAIVFFSRMGKDYVNFTNKLATWMLNNMVHKQGFFYYQIKKRYVNKIPYIRWGQAWAFHALTEYVFQQKEHL